MNKNQKLKNPCISFVGSQATEVTGSASLLRFLDYQILIDYGLRQSSNIEEDYLINSKRHKDIKPKHLDAIVLTHCHIDHCGLIPKLYAEGATCPLYIPAGTKSLLLIMWEDTVKILSANKEKYGHKMLYTEDDIETTRHYIQEIELYNPTAIAPEVTFTYYNSQHIVKARQIYFELNDGVTIKRAGFTGDISSYSNTYWLQDNDILPYTDVLIGECTYGNAKRLHKDRDRKTDINKLQLAVNYALEHKSKVIIPTFSLNRLQTILAILYEVYNGKSPIRIVVDSPLGLKISKLWGKYIDKDADLWQSIWDWDNIYWVKDFKESIAFNFLDEPLLIIASGGFLQGGRAPFYVKENLPKHHNYIVFTGYSTPESPAGQIKSGELHEITIDGKRVKNNAHIITLNSLSSHCDYKYLLKYYLETKYGKICLVHGEQESKLAFAEALKNELSQVNRTARVIITNKDTKIHF